MGFDEKEIDDDSKENENEEEDYNEGESYFDDITLTQDVKRLMNLINLEKIDVFLNKNLNLIQI